MFFFHFRGTCCLHLYQSYETVWGRADCVGETNGKSSRATDQARYVKIENGGGDENEISNSKNLKNCKFAILFLALNHIGLLSK